MRWLRLVSGFAAVPLIPAAGIRHAEVWSRFAGTSGARRPFASWIAVTAAMLIYIAQAPRLRHAGRARRQHRLLPAGAHRAGRSAHRRSCPSDASLELQEQMRAAYGFDKPLPVQYALWLWKVLHGDLGTSIATGRPVATEVGARGRQHADPRLRGDADRLHLRHVLRLRRRLFPRLLARQARLRGLGARRQRAALLARHGAGHHLLGAARLAAADRRGAGRLRQLAARPRSTCATSSCRRSRCR